VRFELGQIATVETEALAAAAAATAVPHDPVGGTRCGRGPNAAIEAPAAGGGLATVAVPRLLQAGPDG
jgi:hypothetical protein